MNKYKITSAILASSLLITPISSVIQSYVNVANASEVQKSNLNMTEVYKMDKYISVDYKNNKLVLDEDNAIKDGISIKVIEFVKNNIKNMNELSKEKYFIINSDKSVQVSVDNPYVRSGGSYIKTHWNGHITMYLTHYDTQQLIKKYKKAESIGKIAGYIKGRVGRVAKIYSIAMKLSWKLLKSSDKGKGVVIEYNGYRDFAAVRGR